MIVIDRLTFAYAGSSETVLKDVSAQFHEGEFVLIAGRSGCGKSTLLRAINGLIPHFYGGTYSGTVSVDDRDVRKTAPSRLADLVGIVFQDPETQLVMTNVENEMAFGLENLAVPLKEMKDRVGRYSEYFGLSPLLERFIPELSGGEKQKVALGSVLAMHPKYILLDEPTSQLDTETAALFLEFVSRLNKEMNLCVVLVEHRLERCLKYADRVIVIDEGRVVADGPRASVLACLQEKGLVGALSKSTSKKVERGEVVLSMRGVRFAYDHTDVLSGVDLDLRQGEMVAITGANGTGKSTLIKQLNGLLRPSEGTVTILGRDVASSTTAGLAHEVGYLGQNPNDYLFEETLVGELEFTLENLNVEKGEWEERIDWTLRMLDLSSLGGIFPRDLSCGQRERTALASVLVGRPPILVLDEPTRGLDYWNKMKLGNALDNLRGEGMSILLVTHDYRFIAEHATRVFRLSGGRLTEVPLSEIIALAAPDVVVGGA